jgi:hypothetical protein
MTEKRVQLLEHKHHQKKKKKKKNYEKVLQAIESGHINLSNMPRQRVTYCRRVVQSFPSEVDHNFITDKVHVVNPFFRDVVDKQIHQLVILNNSLF